MLRNTHIWKWATILACVAMRILRLTYLARTQPEEPATLELGQNEIDAVLVLRQPPGYRLGQVRCIAEAVHWIAEVGGYTGKSSGGAPGATVIGRGLARVQTAAETIASLRKMKM